MHERTYDLAKQNRSKHACICVNVTNEFVFSREGEKEQTCAFRMYWAMESFLMIVEGSSSKTWKRGRVKLDHPLLQVEISITSVAYKKVRKWYHLQERSYNTIC
jgi:hypothetical protein